MKLWMTALVIPGGLALLLLGRWLMHRHRLAQFEAKTWRQQLEALEGLPPLALPPVKPLTATRQSSDHRLVRFQERLRG